MKYLVTTPWKVTHEAASWIEDTFEDAGVEATPQPHSFRGIVLVEADQPLDRDEMRRLPEVEKVIPIEREIEGGDVDAIADIVAAVADRLPEGSSFAVRATRRGHQGFSSQDIEKVAGARVLDQRPDLEVDLTEPERVLRVETMHAWTGVGVLSADELHTKKGGKLDARAITSKLTVAQLVYESGDDRGVDRIGAAVGRAVQAFEVNRLVTLVDQPTSARALRDFLAAVEDGIASRHRIQESVYERDVARVPVEVYELFRMARRCHGDEVLAIATDPRGIPPSEAGDALVERLRAADRIVVFNGANRGLRPSLFTHVDHVLDLAPHVTYGTDQAVTASIVALVNAE